jgi:hypothetical protein
MSKKIPRLSPAAPKRQTQNPTRSDTQHLRVFNSQIRSVLRELRESKYAPIIEDERNFLLILAGSTRSNPFDVQANTSFPPRPQSAPLLDYPGTNIFQGRLSFGEDLGRSKYFGIKLESAFEDRFGYFWARCDTPKINSYEIMVSK